MTRSLMGLKKVALAAGFIAGVIAGTAAMAQDMPTKLTFGVDPNFRPISFAAPDGKVIGFSIELADELSKKLGVPISIEGMAFDGILPALIGKRIDLTQQIVTPQRQQVVDFTRPIIEQTIRAVVRVGSNVDPAPGNLSKLRVGVMVNTSAEATLKEIPDVKPTVYNNVVDEYNDILLGRLDVVVVESVNGAYTVASQFPDKLKMTETVISPTKRFNAIAMRKGEPQVLAKVEAALDSMFQDGSLARIHQKWFGNTVSMPAR